MIRFPGIFFILVLAASAWQSCDKIDAPFVIPAVKTDTSACPVPEFPVVTQHVQRVLLEDYTGHNCPNCPSAAAIAHQLKDEYNDKLILLSVHAGFFAKPSTSDENWKYDFRTEAGTQWDNFFKISAVGNPNGMVNRKADGSNYVVAPAIWAAKVKAELAELPLLDLQVVAEYNATDDKLCIHTKTASLQSVSDRNLNISVLIAEDSIVQPQKNSDPLAGATPSIQNYVHMHVLRGAVNGNWGDVLSLKGGTSSLKIVKSFRIKLDHFNVNILNPNHCSVIVFVYDADTRQVLQTAEARLQ